MRQPADRRPRRFSALPIRVARDFTRGVGPVPSPALPLFAMLRSPEGDSSENPAPASSIANAVLDLGAPRVALKDLDDPRSRLSDNAGVGRQPDCI